MSSRAAFATPASLFFAEYLLYRLGLLLVLRLRCGLLTIGALVAVIPLFRLAPLLDRPQESGGPGQSLRCAIEIHAL